MTSCENRFSRGLKVPLTWFYAGCGHTARPAENALSFLLADCRSVDAFGVATLSGCSACAESLVECSEIDRKFLESAKVFSPVDSPKTPSDDCGSRWFFDLKPGAKL